MAKKSTAFKIVCGKQSDSYSFSFKYKFSGTKDISFNMSEDCFLIEYRMQTIPDYEHVIQSALFYDALVKSCIVHFILFSRELSIKNLQIWINSDKYEYPKGDGSPILHLLVKERLAHTISGNWNNSEFIKKILNTSKSKYDSRFSALFALIVSKSKIFEVERFLNLWIAMNGLYGFYANNITKEILDIRKNGKLKPFTESQELLLFQFYCGFELDKVTKEKNDKIGSKITDILNTAIYSPSTTKQLFLSDTYSSVRNKIQKLLSENGLSLSAYGYLLIRYAYYLRCNIFHANKPLPLVYLNQKQEWKVFQIINDLLEEFLDENLYRFFLESFEKNEKLRITEHKDVLCTAVQS